MAMIGIDLGTSNSAAAVLRGGRKGDLYLRIEVRIPQTLSCEQRLPYERSRSLQLRHFRA